MQSITAEHPEYSGKKALYRKYRDLYAGGEQMKEHAAEYLLRRQKEALEVYHERLGRVFYENYIGSIIDWYGATLFRREPLINVEGGTDTARRFFSAFAEDSDTCGTSITDFFRRQLVDALVFGSSYALIDFPAVPRQPRSRAEEDAQGNSRAYLVGYTPEHLVNWEQDRRGAFEWIVLRSSRLRHDGSSWANETTWTHFDRTEFRIYESHQVNGEPSEPVLIAEGPHALADLHTVPVVELKIPEGLWLMNKSALIQLEHFNKSNALAWAIHMGLFATPVIYSDRAWDQIVGESYFIQLSPEDRFGWTEPEGKVYQIATDNLARLQQEIYRICYLLNQGGGAAPGFQQSGLSKLRDFAITQEVLRAFGDTVKDSMKRVLRFIAAARKDSVTIDVAGLDEFDIADFRSDLDDAERLLKLGISSPTLQRQIHKRLAQKYLCDVRQEVKDRISTEIDTVQL